MTTNRCEICYKDFPEEELDECPTCGKLVCVDCFDFPFSLCSECLNNELASYQDEEDLELEDD